MKKLLLVLSTMVLGISFQVSASIFTCRSPKLHNGKAFHVYKIDTINRYLREYQHTDLGYRQVREFTNLRIFDYYDDVFPSTFLHSYNIFVFNQDSTYHGILMRFHNEDNFIYVDQNIDYPGYKCEIIDEVP